MPSLQVRDCPEALYLKLQRLAKAENRSLAQETIAILKKATGHAVSGHKRRKAIINTIKSTVRDDFNHLPAPAILVREDRER